MRPLYLVVLCVKSKCSLHFFLCNQLSIAIVNFILWMRKPRLMEATTFSIWARVISQWTILNFGDFHSSTYTSASFFSVAENTLYFIRFLVKNVCSPAPILTLIRCENFENYNIWDLKLIIDLTYITQDKSNERLLNVLILINK